MNFLAHQQHVQRRTRFEAKILPHYKLVLRIVLSRAPLEAEDVVQQVFMTALRAWDAGFEPQHPVSWLVLLARRETNRLCQQRVRLTKQGRAWHIWGSGHTRRVLFQSIQDVVGGPASGTIDIAKERW